jgi:hypothetical protein
VKSDSDLHGLLEPHVAHHGTRGLIAPPATRIRLESLALRNGTDAGGIQSSTACHELIDFIDPVPEDVPESLVRAIRASRRTVTFRTLAHQARRDW